MSSPERQPAPEGSDGDAGNDTPCSAIAYCYNCGQAIGFERFHSTSRPIDPDGRLHFATCPKRKRSAAAYDECSYCHGRNTRRGPGNPKVPAHASLICNDCHRQRWLPMEAGW